MKSWQNYIKQIAIVMGLVLLVFLMNYNARLDKLNQLNEKVLVVRAEATAVFKTHISLQTQVAEATSDPVTEKEARNNGEIQEGDYRIIPLPAAGAPLLDDPVLSPPPLKRIKKWEIWVALFFGE